MSSLPAGWYKDPADPVTQRYWDGEGWVGKAIPADATPPEGPPPPEEEPAPVPAAPQAAAEAKPEEAPTAPAQPLPPEASMPQVWSPPPGYPPPPPGWTPPPGWNPPPGFTLQIRPHGMALADMGSRLVARLIDIAAVLLMNVLVNGWFAYQFAQEFAPMWRAAMADPFGEQPTPSTRAEYLLWAMLIIATLLWLLYEAPSIAGRGQTLGKRVMRIKVVAVENTEPIGFGRAFRRWARLGLWTPFWACAGLGALFQLIDSISPLFDRKLHQALHDKTARTVVVAVPLEKGSSPEGER